MLLTANLSISSLCQKDAPTLLAYESRNRKQFAPHGPHRTDADFTLAACENRIELQLRDIASGASSRWLIRLREKQDEVIGHLAITSIQRGVRHTGFVGYGMDHAHTGQGLMTEALTALTGYAFTTLNLHRLEATHRPDNLASARILQKVGFEREGLARNYLYLNGAWADSVLNALINPHWQPSSNQIPTPSELK